MLNQLRPNRERSFLKTQKLMKVWVRIILPELVWSKQIIVDKTKYRSFTIVVVSLRLLSFTVIRNSLKWIFHGNRKPPWPVFYISPWPRISIWFCESRKHWNLISAFLSEKFKWPFQSGVPSSAHTLYNYRLVFHQILCVEVFHAHFNFNPNRIFLNWLPQLSK